MAVSAAAASVDWEASTDAASEGAEGAAEATGAAEDAAALADAAGLDAADVDEEFEHPVSTRAPVRPSTARVAARGRTRDMGLQSGCPDSLGTT